ncbi:MAG: glycosyltransferase family 39 protein [Bacteroidota bacterium]
MANISLRSSWPYYLAIAVVFSLLAAYTFDSKVQPFGDNTTYYILGKALAEGEGYHNISQIDKPAHTHFPPGYPVFLASLLQLVGDNPESLKVANLVLLGVAILLFFRLSLVVLNQTWLALSATLIVCFNPSLIQFGSYLMSETLFLTLTLLSLLCYLWWKEKPSWVRLLLLALMLAATFYTRSLGMALIGAVVLAQLWERNWKSAIALLGAIFLLFLPWSLRNASLGSTSYLKQLVLRNPYRPEEGTMQLTDWWSRVIENGSRYLKFDLPDAFFTYIQQADYSQSTATQGILGLALVGLIVLGILQLKKHRLLIGAYAGATALILILWPEVWFGVRFILPLVPVLTLGLVLGIHQGLQRLLAQATKSQVNWVEKVLPALPLLLIVFCLSDLRMLHRDSQAYPAIPYQNYYAVAEWVKENTPEETVICTRKGSLFYYHANRYVTMFKRTENHQEFMDDLRAKQVDLLVLDNLGYQDVNTYMVPVVLENPEFFEVLLRVENPTTALVQFYPEGKPSDIQIIQP